jgi:hypothetical protein
VAARRRVRATFSQVTFGGYERLASYSEMSDK